MDERYNYDLKKKVLSRDQLLEIASEVVEYLYSRTTAKVFRERQDDRIRLQFARVTVQAIAAVSTILKDAELDELKARLERLEEVET